VLEAYVQHIAGQTLSSSQKLAFNYTTEGPTAASTKTSALTAFDPSIDLQVTCCYW